MNATVDVALVGICGYGASYLNALLDAGGDDRDDAFRIVGVVDPAAARSPRLSEVRERGIPVYAELADLYAATKTRVDLTVTCTPIHLHAQHTCLALAHGSRVLCEKPLSATVEDAIRVEAAERRHGLFVSVGFQWSFSHAVQQLKRDVMSGVFGKARRLRTVAMFPRAESYYRRNAWAGRVVTEWGERVFDSPLNNATAHYLHNMLYVLGPTRESSATPKDLQAELYRANEIESFDTAALRCHTTCGAEVLFFTTHAAPQRVGPVCRFEFDHATIEFDYARGGRFVARFHDGRLRDYGQPELDRSEKIWQSIDAVRTGAAVACGAKAALPHAMCVGAARASFPTCSDFPESLRRRGTLDGDGSMIWIDGLADALSECYEQAILPSDNGFPWAKAGKTVEVSPEISPPAAKDVVPSSSRLATPV
jgi:predicted dehydrogenase